MQCLKFKTTSVSKSCFCACINVCQFSWCQKCGTLFFNITSVHLSFLCSESNCLSIWLSILTCTIDFRFRFYFWRWFCIRSQCFGHSSNLSWLSAVAGKSKKIAKGINWNLANNTSFESLFSLYPIKST